MKITAGIITRNESRNIHACIERLKWCDEILVVDAESTDQTSELARQAGARVATRRWTGFADQRNYLLEQATHPWVLFVDADERMPQEASALIREHVAHETPTAAFRFPRRSFYLNRWIKHGGWSPDYQVRLLRKQKNRFVNNLVHERVESDGPVKTLSVTLEHYPFQNIVDQVETNNRYSSLLAQALHQQGVRFQWRGVFIKPWVKFIECYFLKRGFLDGFPGFFIAVSAGYSVFMKWAKLREFEFAERAAYK